MKRQSITVLTAAIILAFFSTTVFAVNGDMGAGTDPLTDGSEAYPYLIEDFDDFDEFASDPNYWDDCTRLDCDIDLDPALSGRVTYTTAVIAPNTSGSYNNFQGTVFTGIFDGNDHTISNLSINNVADLNGYLGLFGKISGSDAEVKNLGIEDCNIISVDYSYFLGGLCGLNQNGTITNCYATGSVDGSYYLGGLCGRNHGIIRNCHSSGSVTGSSYLGGLCGYNEDGIISNCYTTGYADGAVSGVGGLCGYNINSTIINCYATGSVIGSYDLGGLCGGNQTSTISNCYAGGSVTGGSNVGGLCGIDYDGTANDCFWDTETSGQSTSAGGTGKTTAEMKTVSTFLDAGWDLITVWNIEEDQICPLLRKYSAVDTNYDNKVDLIDFADFANYWLNGVE